MSWFVLVAIKRRSFFASLFLFWSLSLFFFSCTATMFDIVVAALLWPLWVKTLRGLRYRTGCSNKIVLTIPTQFLFVLSYKISSFILWWYWRGRRWYVTSSLFTHDTEEMRCWNEGFSSWSWHVRNRPFDESDTVSEVHCVELIVFEIWELASPDWKLITDGWMYSLEPSGKRLFLLNFLLTPQLNK